MKTLTRKKKKSTVMQVQFDYRQRSSSFVEDASLVKEKKMQVKHDYGEYNLSLCILDFVDRVEG